MEHTTCGEKCATKCARLLCDFFTPIPDRKKPGSLTSQQHGGRPIAHSGISKSTIGPANALALRFQRNRGFEIDSQLSLTNVPRVLCRGCVDFLTCEVAVPEVSLCVKCCFLGSYMHYEG